MSAKGLTRSVVAVVLVVLAAAGYWAGRRNAHETANTAATMPAVSVTSGVPDFSGLVQAYGPTVVNIRAQHVARRSALPGGARQLPIDPNDPFYQFFKRFYGNLPGFGGGDQGGNGDNGDGDDGSGQSGVSLGSGFIISPDGYLLTNAHVVEGASSVTVTLTDKREFHAKVIGADRQSDVAVLKIDAQNLPSVKIGDASQSKVGQWVVAIGSPYGFDNTVTAGIISAKSRSLPNENYTPFIQTDVPVNPGNSGGPLFNLSGEVIGINSMIYSQTGGFQGLSFAIPIDEAMKVKDELMKTGHVSRGRLGVAIQPVTQALADSFSMAKPQGALVSSVDASGPAAKAGLQPGDVILAVNGQAVNDSSDLPAIIAAIQPGNHASVQIWRDKAARSVDVTIGSLGDAKPALAQNAPAQGAGRLGVTVRPLTPQEKNSASLTQGLVVERAGGAAASAGIQPGDVILAVNGHPVASVQQFTQMVTQAGKNLALLIDRDGSQIFVAVDLG